MTTTPGLVESAVGAAPVAVRLRGTVGHDANGRTFTGGDRFDGPAVVSVGITRWRNRPDTRPEPAAAAIELTAAAFGAVALPELGDTVAVQLTDEALAWAGLASTSDARWRFLGKVTDADTAPATPRHPATVRIVAVGPQANGGAKVGAAPWPAQLDGDRAQAILDALVALQPPADEYVAAGPVDPGTVTVLARDVDAQPANGLLEALALDSGGELVELRDGSLAWHDASHRRGAAAAVELWARHILAAPAWRKQLGGLVNDLTLGYGPTPAGGSQPELQVVDQLSVDRVGRFDARRSTQLADQATAQSRAAELVGRFGIPRWRLDAFTVDLTRTVDPARAGALLGLTFGSLLLVDGIPDQAGTPANARLWCEGQREDVTRQAWRLTLYASDYAATGPAPRWVDVPTTTSWADVDPALSWLGAAAWWPGDASTGRWVDVAADQAWTETPTTETWATAA